MSTDLLRPRTCDDVGPNSGSQVDIGASVTVPGGGGDRTTRDPTHSPIPAPEPEPEPCLNGRCGVTYELAGPPEVTLADLASFRPAAPTLGGEPAGFGVVGMPTNVMATASEQRIAGRSSAGT